MCTALADRTQKKSSFYEKKPPFRTKKRTCLNVLLMQTTYQKQTFFLAKLRYFQRKSIQKTAARHVYCLDGPHTEKELILREKTAISDQKAHLVECIVDADNISETDIFSGKTSIFPEKKHSENRSTACVLPWRTAHRKRAHFTSKYRHFGSKSAPG